MPDKSRQVAVHRAHSRLRLVTREIERAIAILDQHAGKFLGGCPAGELSVAFLTDEGIAHVHENFMNDPTATDVITFEGDPAIAQAGEICVSVDTAARYVGIVAKDVPSKSQQIKFSAELTLYIVHGWLHLAGYDDLQPPKKRRMRAAEKRAMTLLHEHRALPSFQLR